MPNSSIDNQPERPAIQDDVVPNIDSAEVRRVLDLMRPAILADGGDVEFVDIRDGGVVTVRFHGACIGCPSSSMTLQSGIERNLKEHVPGVQSVVAVE